MKPLLLVEALAARNDSGLGRHVRLFVEALADLRDIAEIRVVLPLGMRKGLLPEGFGSIRIPARPYRFVCECIWPLLIAVLRPRAVLCLGQSLPAWRPASRYALLVPDAAPLEDLPYAASGHPDFNRRWMQRRIPKADRVLTSAEFTRGRLQALLGIAPEKVAVIPPVPGGSMQVSQAIAEAAPVDPPYFLAVGNVEPRKNYPSLLQAYALLIRRHPDLPPLHILGHQAWDDGAAMALRTGLGLEQKVFFHGHVSEAMRTAFVRACAIFISSSLYEGFGLPLFEALQAGKACIYHGDSAASEFTAGCALATDCSHPEKLAADLESLWYHEGLRRDLERQARTAFAARWEAYSPGAALRRALQPLLD